MVKEARFNYTNIINTNIVTGKRVRTEVVKHQPKSAEELRIEANERRIEAENRRIEKAEKRRIEREKQRIEQEKQKEKGVPKKVAEVIRPYSFSLYMANAAMGDMERDLGRKLTKEEKKKIRQDFRD